MTDNYGAEVPSVLCWAEVQKKGTHLSVAPPAAAEGKVGRLETQPRAPLQSFGPSGREDAGQRPQRAAGPPWGGRAPRQ